MTDMKRVAVLAAVIAIAAVILIVLLLCRSASFVQPTETTAIVPDDLDSAALSVAADGLGTAPSPEVIRNELFTPVISFHPGTAGSSLGRAAATAHAMAFSAEYSLSDADEHLLSKAMLTAWESLAPEEQVTFLENIGGVISTGYDALADYSSVEGIFGDAGVAELAKAFFASPDARSDWQALEQAVNELMGSSLP